MQNKPFIRINKELPIMENMMLERLPLATIWDVDVCQQLVTGIQDSTLFRYYHRFGLLVKYQQDDTLEQLQNIEIHQWKDDTFQLEQTLTHRWNHFMKTFLPSYVSRVFGKELVTQHGFKVIYLCCQPPFEEESEDILLQRPMKEPVPLDPGIFYTLIEFQQIRYLIRNIPVPVIRGRKPPGGILLYNVSRSLIGELHTVDLSRADAGLAKPNSEEICKKRIRLNDHNDRDTKRQCVGPNGNDTT